MEMDRDKLIDLPNQFENKITCTYSTCITNKPREPITPRFVVVSRSPLLVRCEYCGRYIEAETILEQLGRTRSR